MHHKLHAALKSNHHADKMLVSDSELASRTALGDTARANTVNLSNKHSMPMVLQIYAFSCEEWKMQTCPPVALSSTMSSTALMSVLPTASSRARRA